MHAKAHKRETLKEKVGEELKALVLIAGYLTAFLWAITLYRDLTVNPPGVHSFRYGYAVLEALLLAKVILIGRALNVGKRLPGGVLLFRVLGLTLLYGVLVLAFNVLEHLLEGAMRGEGLGTIVQTLLGSGRSEVLARTLVVLVGFLPITSIFELGRQLGVERVGTLFFRRVTP